MGDENNSYKDKSLKEFILENISNNINTDGINVNEISKRQNFINHLFLFEWFDLYRKYTLENTSKKIITPIMCIDFTHSNKCILYFTLFYK